MSALLLVVGTYLLAGIIALVLLDLLTGRVRGRVKAASYETQTLTGGNLKVAIAVTLLALWLFWPLAIYAALFQGSKGKEAK